jgi:K+-sensing histidine kinase KdpD
LSGSLETNWGKQAASGCAVALSTLALLGVDQFLGSSYLMFAYVLPILFVAAKFGRTAALGAAILSSICAVFFLIEPKFSLEIESSERLRGVAVFLFHRLADQPVFRQAICSRPDPMILGACSIRTRPLPG